MTPRLSTVSLSCFFVGLSWALFHVKYTVVELESEHRNLRRGILNKSEELHVLKAEWTFLNNPERLKKLTVQYLNLEPIRSDQWVTLAAVQKNGLDYYVQRSRQIAQKRHFNKKKVASSLTKGGKR